MPDPVVTLKAGGLSLTSFDALTIQRDIDAFSDAFSFTCPSRQEIRDRIKPRDYTKAEVWMDKTKILTGRVEKPMGSIKSATLNLQGRTLTGVMVDCNLGDPSIWSNLTLGYIGREKATLYGTTVSLPQGDSAKCGEVSASPEDNLGDFLQTLAHDMGWLWHSNADGQLELIRPNPKAKPVASLIEGEGALQDVSTDVDGTKMWQDYHVTMDMGGWPGVEGRARDDGIPVHRFKQRSGGTGQPGQINQAAAWDRAHAIAEAVSISAVVSTWSTDSGLIWEPGQIINLKAPTAYINKTTSLMIAGVTFTLSKDEGFTTTLRLVLPTLYSGTVPEVWPWD